MAENIAVDCIINVMHFLLFSLPSLQISDCGAPRSPSKVYREFGSSSTNAFNCSSGFC